MLEDAPPGVTPEQWMRALAITLAIQYDGTARDSTRLKYLLRQQAPLVYDYIKNGKTPPL